MSGLFRFLAGLTTAVALHELGHLGMAKFLGIPCRRARIRLLGAELTFDFSRAGYLTESLVHLAGPLAGFFAAVLALRWNAVRFAGISAALSLINLLPLEGFDGGGILRCILAPLLPPDAVCRITRAVSRTLRLLFWVCAARFVLRSSADMSLILFATGVILTEN